ncbi:PAAR-like domain-containing protein [Hyalangium minutum]|uniref:Tox-GHH2 domain-containing protein n=1 Tax=Hyalangium minutum TaxID=394096 RepID=A0A085WIT7_9BACT|nr:PAAR-like domain-containing protein [Hyalangium minutum]KFE67600.1 hypothetical protein DB31_8083 [Hyalangium minutum]
MQTHVYANGREICSQAADGKSSAAFPDVCWSPPAPPAGPIQLPYPNTAFAKDLANGTNTVFICGSIVARKDESYISTSTGNEPATRQFPKGVNTGALKGKAYFTSWSMNVMVEGSNVPRHQDLMTHNHASPGGQTPAHTYVDDALKDFPKDCKKERKAILQECGPEPKESEQAKNIRKARRKFLSKVGERFNKVLGGANGSSKGGNTAWMEHCDGLWIKPSADYHSQMEKLAGEIQDIKNDLGGIAATVVKPAIESLGRELLERAAREAAERAVKLGARSAARWGVGAAGAAVAGVGVIVTETIATAWNVYDMASTAYEGYQLTSQMMDSLNEIKDVMGHFDNALQGLDSAWQDAKSNPQKAIANLMQVIARLNSCVRARRCNLVPFKNTDSAKALGGSGCCPGQTGHHVLPHSMTEGNCPGYKEDEAPTLCVEGVNWSHGSHGMMHRALKARMDDYKNGWFGSKTEISYEKARDLGIKSITDTFPESKCSEDCLKAQLDKYYKDKCKSPLPPVSGMPGRSQKIPSPKSRSE